jgi:1-acyl-sn-glycerol-3-phosphate acyltransferase
LFGWKVVGQHPSEPKFVLIGAYHTSNWDLPLAILIMWALKIDARWVAKHTIFRGPAGWLFRRLGGVPLNRETTENFVESVGEEFDKREEFVLVLAPEGTRSRVEYWRTGFYYIALRAGVPIALGFVDSPRKEVGLGPLLWPSGDLEADLAKMRDFYSDKTGIRPEKHGEIRARPGGAPQSA